MYKPSDVDSNTAIHFHFKGSGSGGDLTNTAKNIAEYGGNSIVLMPTASYTETDVLNGSVESAIDAMQKEYNLDKIKFSTDGWSGGSYGALETFVYCANKEGVEFEGIPMIHFLDDASPLTTNVITSQPNLEDTSTWVWHEDSRTNILTNMGGNVAIAKYHPIMITYCDDDSGTMVAKDACMADYYKAGAISIKTLMTHPNDHRGVKNNMHLAGVQDVNANKSELPLQTTDDYFDGVKRDANDLTYLLVIGTDKEGKPIYETIPDEYATTKEGILVFASMYGLESVETAESIKNFYSIFDPLGPPARIVATSNIFSYDYSLMSELEAVDVCVNNISSAMLSSSIVQGKSEISFSGNTMVSNSISSVMQKYILASTQLLLKISDDLNFITRISHSIKIMDKNVAKEASNLNDDITMHLAKEN